MISLEQYFHNPKTGEEKEHSPEQTACAHDLLERVNAIVDEAEGLGVFDRDTCKPTGCEISGSVGGTGDGGFRSPDSSTGAPHSSHREARAVDVYDPHGALDDWLDTFEDGSGGNSKLEQYGLYREAPDSTHGWTHLTTRAPGSGRRTFQP